MAAVANNPKFAKKVGVPQKVGKEFSMKKYQMGGMAAMGGETEEERRRRMMRGAMGGGMGGGGAMPAMKKGGMAKMKKYAKGGKVTRGDGMCSKGHTKGKMV
jgi:hypothetical protein